MKVLLREFGNEQYVWENAEIDSDTSFIVDGERVLQTNVVSVFRDNRTNFVKCSMCGAILKNVPEVIAPHLSNAHIFKTVKVLSTFTVSSAVQPSNAVP